MASYSKHTILYSRTTPCSYGPTAIAFVHATTNVDNQNIIRRPVHPSPRRPAWLGRVLLWWWSRKRPPVPAAPMLRRTSRASLPAHQWRLFPLPKGGVTCAKKRTISQESTVVYKQTVVKHISGNITGQRSNLTSLPSILLQYKTYTKRYRFRVPYLYTQQQKDTYFVPFLSTQQQNGTYFIPFLCTQQQKDTYFVPFLCTQQQTDTYFVPFLCTQQQKDTDFVYPFNIHSNNFA